MLVRLRGRCGRNHLHAAVGDADPIPAGPEQRVLPAVTEPDEARAAAVPLEHVGHLGGQRSSAGQRPLAMPSVKKKANSLLSIKLIF